MKKSAPVRVGLDARVLGQRGVGRYLSNLINAMAAQKGAWELTLFVQTNSRKELIPKDSRFRVVDLGSTHPAYAEQFLIPKLSLKLKLDALHYPDNSGCVRPPLPMVLTMHDGMWRRPLKQALLKPNLRQRLQDAYRKWVCPRAARAAARVITVSEFSANELRQALGLNHVEVIAEGLDPAFAKRLTSKTVAKELKGLGLKAPYVLCSGAADRRKNIDRLIQAFAVAKLDGVELVITSLREGEQAATSYEETIRAAGLQGRVRLLGYVSDMQMKALYQGALVYAFPSLWEGFGLPILEAYAAGVPVLASTTGALPEVAGKGALLVDPYDVQALASGLKKLSKSKRASLAAKGFKELRRFSWERAARETLEVYRAVGRCA